jgi:hypothetical protein
MNDKNQNSPKPDYGFILNQASPEAPHGKKDKKFLLVAGLLVLLTIVIFSSLLVSAKRKVATTGTKQTPDVPAAFLEDINTSQDDKAYALFSSDLQKKMTKESFNKNLASSFRTNVDLNSCAKSSTTADSNPQAITYTCNLKGSLKGTITINVTPSAGTVTDINWKLTAS